MCGFVAMLAPQCPPEEMASRLQRMLASIVHRGPDDSGIEMNGPVGQGFRRLSILDLSPSGHQPMASADGSCTITFNGEIYNYLELRKELQALGHVFRSSGDTEVLLAAYRQWGSDCLRRLNGMWAFVIHDRAKGLLFGARDRFGIKPLYRWQEGSNLLLASEIKAIRASGLWRGGMDRGTMADFLYRQALDSSTRTFYEGISQVPAAHAFEVDMDGCWREWRYWDCLAEAMPTDLDPPQAFAEMFEDAMRIHMRSDVPVGVNLSGGLDSTSILCAAARLRDAGQAGDLLAFCYQDRQFDERRYIHDTLTQTGARLVALEMSPRQLWDSLPAVLAMQDEPVHSMTALVGYHLTSLAANNGVKVVLNGQGADEVIGGYGSYFRDNWAERIAGGHWRAAVADIEAYVQAQGGSVRQLFIRAARHAVQSRLAALGPYRAVAGKRSLRRLLDAPWIRLELAARVTMDDLPPTLGLSATLADAVQRDPLPLYLRVEDRNSMAHSIEVRLPFLDHRLVSLVFGMRSNWKLRGPWNKYVLREGMRGRIPESVRSRVDKMGFPTNASSWFKGELYEPLRAVLTDPGFRRSDLFDAASVAGALDAHKAGKVDVSGQLFTAAQIHIWQQQTF